LTGFHLAPSGWLPCTPGNTVTSRVGRRDFHRATCETIAKNVAHVVPNLVAVETISENRLAGIWLEEATFDWADLQCDAAGCRIGMKNLAVGCVFGDDVLLANTATDGPQVDGIVALISYNRSTNGLRTSDKGNGSDSESVENHDAVCNEWRSECNVKSSDPELYSDPLSLQCFYTSAANALQPELHCFQGGRYWIS
jgi:hypothetical protein